VGWDQLHLTSHGRECALYEGVAEGSNVYFTHSYALADDVEADVVTTRSHYTRSFASGIWAGNVYGVQFHPEKSSRTGLAILRNFVTRVCA
jgi:glutamine amidotransferase